MSNIVAESQRDGDAILRALRQWTACSDPSYAVLILASSSFQLDFGNSARILSGG